LTKPKIVCTFLCMEDKPKRGRPPKGAASRSARIDIRAEPSEKERYERAAGKAGLSLTDWMKERLGRAAKRELGD
jgi:uncharacterized protein (DUF1778 family)